MTRAIFSECSASVWPDAAERLSREHGWDIRYWIGAPNVLAEIGRRFPTCTLHSSLDAIRDLPARTQRDVIRRPLDDKVATALEPFEAVAVDMMDRMDPDGRSFTLDERRAHFWSLAHYWSTVIDVEEPDVVVFPVTPHVVYDYVLYALCRLRRVRTIVLMRTALPGQLLVLERFEDGSPAVREAYRRLQEAGAPPELDAVSAEHLDSLSGPWRDAMPKFFDKKLRHVGQDPNARRLNIESWRYLPAVELVRQLVRARRYFGGSPPPNYLKVRGEPVNESWIGAVGYARYRASAMTRKRSLLREHRAVEVSPDVSQPFVFVPLHYQPERTSSPEGWPWVDQGKLVRAVADAVPETWRVVVKEHILQLGALGRGELRRHRGFYEELASHPKVDLVPLHQPTFEVLDAAAAVATITGTSGWEAIVRGVPALVFGHAWYRDCDGAWPIHDPADIEAALRSIAAGARPDPTRVRWFVQAVSSIAITGYVDDYLADVAGVGHEDNVANLTKALAAAVP